MAQVRLWINPREYVIYDLPRVCMKCGAHATTVKKRQFSWYPPWLLVLLLAGLLPFAIVVLILTKRQSVEIPFCDTHKYHFGIRVAAALGGLALVLALGGLMLVIAGAAAGNNNDDVFGFLCLGWVALFVIYLVAISVFSTMTTIRPTEITDRRITLTNVAPEFVRALEEEEAEYDRDLDRDVRDRWRENRRRDRYPDDDRYERGDDRPPPRRSTDITEGEGE
jgi:hypothetical protein